MLRFVDFWKGKQTFRFKAKITLLDHKTVERELSLVASNLNEAESDARESIHRDFRYNDVVNIQLWQI